MRANYKLEKPLRDPDHISKRGVFYWWSPDWIRGTNGGNTSFGRIKAIKENGTVNLYMLSKTGNESYIQGSIQKEFKEWHELRKIDYFFLASDPNELDDIILSRTYKVVRDFFSGDKEVLKKGLTLEEAKEHCQDPETSSSTCTSWTAKNLTKHRGPWFDRYQEE